MTGQVRLNVFIASTAGAALAAVVWAIPRVEPIPALIVTLVIFVAERFASEVREKVLVSLSSIMTLVAVMIGGPELGLVAALGAVPAFAMRPTANRLLHLLFNSGQFIVSAAAGGTAYATIDVWLGGTVGDWRGLLAVTSAAAAMCVANHALVAGVVALSTQDSFLDTFRTIGPSLAMQIPYVGIAVLTVVVLERASWWALLLMAVPALIARYGLLAFQELDRSYDRLVRSFVKAIEIKDLYTQGHSLRVSQLSVHVADELGIGYEERRVTKYAALLHDVGKIGVRLCVINKPGPLDDDEFAEMQRHPTIGASILHDIDFLEPAIDIVRYHHERLDGGGYPHGVGADQLPRIVRIVTAVDAFDAMTSTRSYRRALAVEEAVAELRRCTGGQFDAEVVEALARCVERVGWEPTKEFASEAELRGAEIPDAGVGELRRSQGVRTSDEDAAMARDHDTWASTSRSTGQRGDG